MAGISVNSGFDVGAPVPLDSRQELTKEQMKAMNDNIMPETYFAVCSEDKAMYIYSKNNTVDETTGKFRKQVSASGGVTADAQRDTSLGEDDYIAVFTSLT